MTSEDQREAPWGGSLEVGKDHRRAGSAQALTEAPGGACVAAGGGIWRWVLLRRPELPWLVFSRKTWTGQ